MSDQEIRFQDGAGYENMMGVWSRLVGEDFLAWLSPRTGKRWLDVGCGNGAFTELVVDRCAPGEIYGIDPSEAQLAYAQTRRAGSYARFQQGSAMALPFPDAVFDCVVSALVVFFMPDPGKGVGEMARVARSGGMVASYVWDMLGGGFPYEPFFRELRALGASHPMPPHSEAAELAELDRLWRMAGLRQVETRRIAVERRFDSFEDYWVAAIATPGLGAGVLALPAGVQADLKRRVQADGIAAPDGSVTRNAWAHAVRGVAP